MSSITEKVAEQIASSGENIKERVIQHLVAKEVERRSEAVIKALDSLDKLKREGLKIKPDVVSYGDDGKIASQAWSKAKIDERNTNQSKIDKLQAALNKGLDEGDFASLFNLVNGNAKPEHTADKD
jgi:hypothetical protein